MQYIESLDVLKVACNRPTENVRKLKAEIVVFGINVVLKMFIEMNFI